MLDIINFKDKSKQTIKSELEQILEDTELVYFPPEHKGKFALNPERVEEWLDNRTLNGQKMKPEYESKINDMIFVSFLHIFGELNAENAYTGIGVVSCILSRLGDKKFQKYFEKQIAQSIYPYINIKLDNINAQLEKLGNKKA